MAEGVEGWLHKALGNAATSDSGPGWKHPDALFLASPGIRTWIVQECDQTGTDRDGASMRVFKDFWLDGTDHDGEKRIRSRVYTTLQHEIHYKPTLRKLSAERFVAGVIFVNAVEAPVLTKNLARKLHDSLPIEPDGKPHRTHVLRNSWAESLNQPLPPLCATPGRVHRRVLPQRQCVPLYKLCDSVPGFHRPAGSLQDVFKVLGDLTTMLKALKDAGIVH
ncbi:hypothetical protein BKA70DRAFT_728196 [Coprinopsis sp. MPI-PUGE-AT-0042]|nr:hypothetical protein BKA70DRAFT_728196 [Coprinopsis sp. MPI-PUGE-AT-0042]